MNAKKVVLAVDDDVTVRRVLKLAFERAGYRVLVAEHGKHALELLDLEPAPVDIVVTDVVMPTMDGATLAAHVRTRAPSTRIVFISGFLPQANTLDRVVGGKAVFVQKPFDVDALTKLVHRELEAR